MFIAAVQRATYGVAVGGGEESGRSAERRVFEGTLYSRVFVGTVDETAAPSQRWMSPSPSPSPFTWPSVGVRRRQIQDFCCLHPPAHRSIHLMATPNPQDNGETLELLQRADQGDREALNGLFSRHRGRLERMVSLRMAEALRGRVDPADVVQESLMEASCRLPEFLASPDVPFFIWLRFLTNQNLMKMHRHHLGTQARDPRREVSLYARATPPATTEALAAQLLGQLSTPSEKFAAVELKLKLQEALNTMHPQDREIVALRHYEQLSNVECAQELGIQTAAASKRYIRALDRLRTILVDLGVEPPKV